MKAFIVVGPEKSGNHLTASLIAERGCKLELALEFTPDRKSNYVWQGSMPKDRSWYDITKIYRNFEYHGYVTVVVVVSRGWVPVIKSQINSKFVSDSTKGIATKGVIEYAFRRIFSAIITDNLKFLIVNYESIIHEEAFRTQHLPWLLFGDEIPPIVKPSEALFDDVHKKYFNQGIVDENKKYANLEDNN